MTIGRPELSVFGTGWRLAGAVGFLAFGLWQFPLAMALSLWGSPTFGLSYRAAEGTVWNGRILHASLFGGQLGDVSLHLEPLGLLTGSAGYELGSRSGRPIMGRVVSSLSESRVDNLDAHMTFNGALADVGIAAAKVSSLSLLFRGGKCTEASGQLTAYLAEIPAIGGSGLQLSGPATCAAGHLSFRATDPDAKSILKIEYEMGKMPTYTLLFREGSVDKTALQSLGFRQTVNGLGRSGVMAPNI